MNKRLEAEAREQAEQYELDAYLADPEGVSFCPSKHYEDGYISGALSERKRAGELVEALEVIASNGDGRGAGWTPAQHARVALKRWESGE